MWDAHNTTEFPNQPPPFASQLCTFQTCPLSRSVFRYQPSLPLNLIPLVLFLILAIGHCIRGIMNRTWTFTAAVVLGCLLEVGGYVGRVLAHKQPFGDTYYLLQIVLLTVSPVFFCAGIYLCLSRIVHVSGASISRIKPFWYTTIFLTCDFISLALQGSGGALASSATSQAGSNMGVHVMLGGLVFQVFTLLVFIGMCLEFAWRVKQHPELANEATTSLRNSSKWSLFLGSLSIATVLILVRSVYRVAEMALGYDSSLMRNQGTFFVLEAVIVIIAVAGLLVFQPGASLSPFWNYTSDKVSGGYSTSSDETSKTEV